MLAFFLLEKNEEILSYFKTYEKKKMEEEWFCFIEEANFHIIDKQLLI